MQGYLVVLATLEQESLFFKFVLIIIYITLTSEKNSR